MEQPEFQVPPEGYLMDEDGYDHQSCSDFDEFEDLVNDAGTERRLIAIFKKCNKDFDVIETPAGNLFVVNFDGVLHVVDDFYIQRAEEWLMDQVNGGKVENYITLSDFNKEFWESADGVLVYHGTYRDRVEDIQKEGLQPRYETRGLENRGMGDAVFTSPDHETASGYYEVVIEINVGAMKADGYMPEVSMEGPIEEKEAAEALAHLIGLEDWYVDIEAGYDTGTVAFYGVIPPKYLRFPSS